MEILSNFRLVRFSRSLWWAIVGGLVWKQRNRTYGAIIVYGLPCLGKPDDFLLIVQFLN